MVHQPSCQMTAQMPLGPASQPPSRLRQTNTHTHTEARGDSAHVTRSCSKGTLCSCGDFTNRLVFFTLENMTSSQATLTTLGPFNHTHPPIQPWNEMFMSKDRGSSVGAGLRGTLFKAGFVFGGCLERKPINTSRVPHHGKYSPHILKRPVITHDHLRSRSLKNRGGTPL